ncbi:hypothetical protein BH10PLA2_BH10PLA2_00740 [soil metagenome]
MAKAVPLVAMAAGAALAGPLGVGILNAGIGLTAAQGIFAGQLGGFLISTAIGQLAGSALSKKPKAPSFTQEAQGRALQIRSSVETHKIVYGEARVSGPLVFAESANSGPNFIGSTVTGDNIFFHYILPLAGHEIDGFTSYFLNEQEVTIDGDGFVQTAPYLKAGASYVRIRTHLGADDQAADSLLIAEVPSWTAAHRLQGITYAYVRLQYSADVFPLGLVNFSATIKGKKVYDPRDGSQLPADSSTWQWSENVALCIRDYLLAECNVANTRFDDDYTIAAANICDESVTLSNGDSQARYTCNGILDTGVVRRENLNALTSAMAGEVVRVGNSMRIFAGAYDSPVGTITDDILAGEIQIRGATPRSDLVNTVRGTYVDPNKNFQPTDFPPVANATYIEQDNNDVYDKDLELPFTNHPEAAQRIAKIILQKARQGITVEVPLMHHALKYSCWDVVNMTQSIAGFDDKKFRIKQFKMSSVPDGAITVVLQEESPGSYDWNSDEAAAIDDAPNTNLPNPFIVVPSAGLSVTEEIYITRDRTGVKAKAIMDWLASPDAFAKEYQPEFKLSSVSTWTILPKTTDTTAEILDITPGIYDFRLKTLNSLGVSSDYTSVSKQIAGLSAPPLEPQNLTISTIGGLAILRWDPSPDQDVLLGGYYHFRHSPTTSDGWGSSTSIGNAVPGSHTSVTLPLKPGIYLGKALDSSGIESTAVASATTTQATALNYANVDSITEDPAFSGTKTNCTVNSHQQLTINGIGLFSAIPLLSAVPNLASYGGIHSLATYVFDAGIDLGSVQRVRLTSHLQALVANVLDIISSRTTNMSTWTSFTGVTTGDADATVYVSSTNDDPSGTPSWSGWNRLDSGEFVARAFQVECELESFDPAYNVRVSELSITADQVA